MKIGVLIPSIEYRQQAGARIRYDRMVSVLRALGHDMELLPIAGFDVRRAEHDIYLLSKVNDANARICAHVLREQGKLVGIDLFDDYFSQTSDSRLSRFRVWLASMIDAVDFVLCSTPAMARVARSYGEDVPIHVMNDPQDADADVGLAATLARKLTLAQESRELHVAWFGMGDNPHFRVGLNDLSACADVLAQLHNSSWPTSLKIMTNERSLTADGLALLQKLPIPFQLQLWTEEGERQLLQDSLACLLPVNAQNFSVAKSLNRAITALSSGCQIISPRFPLYHDLYPLIYTGAEEFLGDLDQGMLRFRSGQENIFFSKVEQRASADTEGRALVAFLSGLKHVAAEGAPRLFAVLHGVATRGDIGKMTRGLKGLSVATPFCTANLNFDIRFQFERGSTQLICLVSEKVLARLNPEFRQGAIKHGRMRDENYWLIPMDGQSPQALPESDAIPIPVQLQRYAQALDDIHDRLQTLFGSVDVILSELTPLPFGDVSTNYRGSRPL